jgi:hypothetical protein
MLSILKEHNFHNAIGKLFSFLDNDLNIDTNEME